MLVFETIGCNGMSSMLLFCCILDKTTYTDKWLTMLSTKKFLSVETDPTKTLETKIQEVLRKIKSKVLEQEYKQLYPTGSYPGKFYGTAKMHKLPLNGNIDDLPLPPIVFTKC